MEQTTKRIYDEKGRTYDGLPERYFVLEQPRNPFDCWDPKFRKYEDDAFKDARYIAFIHTLKDKELWWMPRNVWNIEITVEPHSHPEATTTDFFSYKIKFVPPQVKYYDGVLGKGVILDEPEISEFVSRVEERPNGAEVSYNRLSPEIREMAEAAYKLYLEDPDLFWWGGPTLYREFKKVTLGRKGK